MNTTSSPRHRAATRLPRRVTRSAAQALTAVAVLGAGAPAVAAPVGGKPVRAGAASLALVVLD